MKLLTKRQATNLSRGIREASDWTAVATLMRRVQADWTDRTDEGTLVEAALRNARIPDAAQRIVAEGGTVTSDDMAGTLLASQHDSAQRQQRIDDALAAGWDALSPTSTGVSVWVASARSVNFNTWARFVALGMDARGADATGHTPLHYLAPLYSEQGGMPQTHTPGKPLGVLARMLGAVRKGTPVVDHAGLDAENTTTDHLNRWMEVIVSAGADPLARNHNGVTAFGQFRVGANLLQRQVQSHIAAQVAPGLDPRWAYVFVSTGRIPRNHCAAYGPVVLAALTHWEDVCGVDYVNRTSLIEMLQRIAADGSAHPPGFVPHVIPQPVPRAR